MRRLSIALAALVLWSASASVLAAPTRPGPRNPAPAAEPNNENDKVAAAIKAWELGDWARVRVLLEPLLQGDRTLAEPLLHETALRYLADATVQDESLDGNIRTELATAYIDRLLNSSPDWRPPEQTHSIHFYELYSRLREQRDRSKAAQCAGERASCRADHSELVARHTRLQRDHALLEQRFNDQEIEVQEKVARNRAVALIPLGVGHFYNGRKGLGAAFLTAELVFGGVGLGLLIARLFDCERENGYKRGSLMCNGEGPKIVARRNAEQAMGLFFVGTLALDVLIAQLTFRSVLTIKSTRVKRSELDAPKPGAAPGTPPGAAPRAPAAAPGKPTSRVRTRDILRLHPRPAFIPGGAGLGFDLRF
jgi:hypothetical protein